MWGPSVDYQNTKKDGFIDYSLTRVTSMFFDQAGGLFLV